jgi:hypothetical protein
MGNSSNAKKKLRVDAAKRSPTPVESEKPRSDKPAPFQRYDAAEWIMRKSQTSATIELGSSHL